MLPDDVLDERLDARFGLLVRELDAPDRSDLAGLERRNDRRHQHQVRVGSALAVVAVLAVLGLVVGTAWSRSGGSRPVGTLQPPLETPAVGAAYRACKASVDPAGDRVAAAYPITVAQARDLIARTVAGAGSDRLTGRPDDEAAVLCYANGPLNAAWYGDGLVLGEARQQAILLADGQFVTFGFQVGTDAVASETLPPVTAFGAVEGRLLRMGGQTHRLDGPVRGTVTLQRVDDPSTNIGVDVASDGAFLVGLRPGRYVVVATSPEVDEGATTCRAAEPSPVDVTLHDTVQVDVVCSLR